MPRHKRPAAMIADEFRAILDATGTASGKVETELLGFRDDERTGSRRRVIASLSGAGRMTRLRSIVFACAFLLGAPAALHAQPSRTDRANPDQELNDFAVPASAAAGGKVLGLVLLVFLVALAFGALFYFVPTAVAILRGHPRIGPITLVNLLLGWTLVGWAVALAWALSAREAKDSSAATSRTTRAPTSEPSTAANTAGGSAHTARKAKRVTERG